MGLKSLVICMPPSTFNVFSLWTSVPPLSRTKAPGPALTVRSLGGAGTLRRDPRGPPEFLQDRTVALPLLSGLQLVFTGANLGKECNTDTCESTVSTLSMVSRGGK